MLARTGDFYRGFPADLGYQPLWWQVWRPNWWRTRKTALKNK